MASQQNANKAHLRNENQELEPDCRIPSKRSNVSLPAQIIAAYVAHERKPRSCIHSTSCTHPGLRPSYADNEVRTNRCS